MNDNTFNDDDKTFDIYISNYCFSVRLEEQHKSELDIYLGELAKWQSEADMLRKQLSENRMMVTKGNITLLKEMQEKDDKIHQLSYACQELQVS